MTKFFVMLLAAVALSGCASTPGGLKSDPDALRTFTVNDGYQVVLKRLVDHQAECVGGPLLPLGQVIYDVKNYTDLRSATITEGGSGFGTVIYTVIELTERERGLTTVQVWSKIRPDGVANMFERIATGAPGCQLVK